MSLVSSASSLPTLPLCDSDTVRQKMSSLFAQLICHGPTHYYTSPGDTLSFEVSMHRGACLYALSTWSFAATRCAFPDPNQVCGKSGRILTFSTISSLEMVPLNLYGKHLPVGIDLRSSQHLTIVIRPLAQRTCSTGRTNHPPAITNAPFRRMSKAYIGAKHDAECCHTFNKQVDHNEFGRV